MNTRGLYIHIPFCKQKCNYCDFASFAGQEEQIDRYLAALVKETSLYAPLSFQTLYVGGGTPSLLNTKQIGVLGEIISQHFGPISRFMESTFEANPESLTLSKIEMLQQLGFNRLSMGLQSFHDQELRVLGRVHTAKQFTQAYQTARTEGFTNINVDLIAGVPGQTLESFLSSLKNLIDLKPEHISVYGLQIEEGTPFFTRGVSCNQDLMRCMLEAAQDILAQAGYHHYEISNYALPGYESKHNMHYWENGEYIGLGSSAASYEGKIRRQNVPSIEEYIRRTDAGETSIVFTEKLTGKAHEGETLMLAFRKLDGVELSFEQNVYFGKEIEKHIQNGLLTRVGKKVKLSKEGLFMANEVFRSFVAPFEDA